MILAEELEKAKAALRRWDGSERSALEYLIDAIEEYLSAQKKEADLILSLADLRRWGGCE